MKVTVRKQDDILTVYFPKKDLELKVVATDPNHAFGGTYELEDDSRILIEPMEIAPRLPMTLNAKKVAS